MKKKNPNPFEGQSDWENNACVNNYMQFEGLASLLHPVSGFLG